MVGQTQREPNLCDQGEQINLCFETANDSLTVVKGRHGTRGREFFPIPPFSAYR